MTPTDPPDTDNAPQLNPISRELRSAHRASRLLAFAVQEVVDRDRVGKSDQPETPNALDEWEFLPQLASGGSIIYRLKFAVRAWAKVSEADVAKEFDAISENLAEIPLHLVAVVSAMKQLGFSKGQKCFSGNKSEVLRISAEILARPLSSYGVSTRRILEVTTPAFTNTGATAAPSSVSLA